MLHISALVSLWNYFELGCPREQAGYGPESSLDSPRCRRRGRLACFPRYGPLAARGPTEPVVNVAERSLKIFYIDVH